MIGLLITILSYLFAIVLIIVVHEYGHFLVARAVGVHVKRFSIGFGKALWSYRARSGTEYVVAMIPLGGYVQMLGETDDDCTPEEHPHAYNSKPLWARMAIVLAGPATNFLLAILLFWLVFMLGVSHLKPMIGHVLPNSIAARAGVQPNSEILRVDGRRTATWQQVMFALIGRMGDRDTLQITTLKKAGDTPKTHHLKLHQWQINAIKPNLFQSLGFLPFFPNIPPVVAKVLPGSPASKAGLKIGDRIIAVNDQPVSDWLALVKDIRSKPGATLTLKVRREGRTQALTLQVGSRTFRGQKVGQMGVLSKPPKWPKSMILKYQYSPLTAWWPAVSHVWTLTQYNALVLAKLIMGKVSLRVLSGPIGIVQFAGQASRQGIKVYLAFLAFISIAIGFINLLPIPGLDGGHFLFQVIELIFRKPLPTRYQAILVQLGIFFIIVMIILVTMNDVLRWVQP